MKNYAAKIIFSEKKHKCASAKIKTNPQTGYLPFADFNCFTVPGVILLLLGSDEFVALAVYVDDFYLVVVLQMLAQFGDVNVH